MSDRMSDEEFGVLYHVELPKWQEELGDPNLDKFADEARRARDEVKAWKAAHKKMEKKLIYVGALAHTGKEPPDVFDSPQADYVRKLRARVAELSESRAEIVDQRNELESYVVTADVTGDDPYTVNRRLADLIRDAHRAKKLEARVVELEAEKRNQKWNSSSPGLVEENKSLRAKVAELEDLVKIDDTTAKALQRCADLTDRVVELEEWIKSQLCTACETGAFADGLFEEGRKP